VLRFPGVCALFDVTFDPSAGSPWLPALIGASLMLDRSGCSCRFISSKLENFAAAMNFVIFPMFFFSSALYPLWKLREGGSEIVYLIAQLNPFTHAVEIVRYALLGCLIWFRRSSSRGRR